MIRHTIVAAVAAAGLVTAAAARGRAADESPAATREPLRSIAAILALPIHDIDAGLEAVITGTVTLSRDFPGTDPYVVLQSGDAAVFVNLPRPPQRSPKGDGKPQGDGKPHDAEVRLGCIVEVTGIIRPGGFAPKIEASSIRSQGDGELPDPAGIDMERLFEGVDVARRVLLRGTVQGVDERANTQAWTVSVWAGGHVVDTDLPQEDFPRRPDWLVDAEIEVVGVVGSYRNGRGEMVAPNLTVARRDDLAVITPAPESPFGAERLPLDDLARYRPRRRGGHRVCTEGVVSRAFPDRLFLHDVAGGVRIDLMTGHEAGACAPGDRVEVAGFVTMRRGIAGLRSAVVRKTGSGPPPQPEPVQPAAIHDVAEQSVRLGTMERPGTYDGCLIRCQARLAGLRAVADGLELELAAGGRLFTAALPATADAAAHAPRLAPGSELELTGIVDCVLTGIDEPHRTPGHPALDRMRLLLSGPADIVVLASPPWWTPRRLAIAAVSLAGAVAAAGIWVTVLRREVRRQTTVALAQAAARRHDAVEYEVSLRERNRLAADLHDTVLQTVTGIRFQLHAFAQARHLALPTEARDETPTVDGHLAAATRMVDQTVEHLRSTVWSLRTLPAEGSAFSAATRDAVASLGAGHPARITLDVDEAADELPAFLGGHLLSIIKEAICNSLRHGASQTIDVRVGIDTAADVVVVSAADDGSGFVLGREPGPGDGHFGLTGMRERAAEIGGTLTIRTTPGGGTTVVVTAPLRGAPRA